MQNCAKYLILMEKNKLANLAKTAGIEDVSLQTVKRQNSFIDRLPKYLNASQSKRDINRLIIKPEIQFNDHTCSFNVSFESDVPKITCFIDGKHMPLKELKASSMDKIAGYADDVISTIKGYDLSHKENIHSHDDTTH